jgi:uncharacterized protein YceK
VLLAVTLALPLAGCGQVHSRALPDLVPYTQSVQAQAAGELEGGACPALAGMIVDYGMVRDQIRALKTD